MSCPRCGCQHSLAVTFCPVTGEPMPTGGPGTLVIGEVLDGRYEVVREIGRGAIGMVYEAVERGPGRRLAIKTLCEESNADAELAGRFERDARAAGALGHPNIVQVFHLGRTRDGLRFLVMELLDGASLASVLRRNPRLDIPLATQIIGQVLAALAAAHKQGIVHRAVKPDNIFVSGGDGRPPEVKLVDFGLAKALKLERKGPASARLVEAKTGPAPAGLAYLAPEQTLGKTAVIDERTDIYAAGVVLYEMLCAQLPYRGNDVPQIVGAILDGNCPPPRSLRPETPPALDATIMRALARTPKDRFPTAEAMRTALTSGTLLPASAVPTAPAAAEDSQAFAVPSLQLSSEPPPDLLPKPAQRDDPAVDEPPAVGIDMTATARARARERGRTLAPAPGRRGFPWLPVVIALALAGGAAVWLLRPQPAPPVIAPPPPPPPEESQSYQLVVDPLDATVEIDHAPVTVRELPVGSTPSHLHHVHVAAPGRLTRSFSFTATPGMKLLLHLGRTLPPPQPTDPPPHPAELAIDYPAAPSHTDEINQAFAKLNRYAVCLAALGFTEGDDRKPSPLGRPRPDQVARCQEVVQEAALKWPKLEHLEAAGAAFIAGAFADAKPEVLAELTLKLRAEHLAARALWQMHELARMDKDEGRKAGWHLRRVALAAQAWVRARKAGAKVAEAKRAELATSLEELGRYPKDEMVRVAGASVFARHAQELLSLGHAKRATDAAVFEACRKLFADFDGLVLE